MNNLIPGDLQYFQKGFQILVVSQYFHKL